MNQPEFSLPDWIRHLRTINNQTQAQQAQLCGVQSSYLSKVENRGSLFHAVVQAAFVKLYQLEGDQLDRFETAAALHNNAKSVEFNDGVLVGMHAMMGWIKASYNDPAVLGIYSPGIRDVYREIVGKTVLQPMRECAEHQVKRFEEN